MMLSFSLPIGFGGVCSCSGRKLIFVLFIFGTVLFCSGILLSIFGFQTCQAEGFGECSRTLKILGPSLAALGLGSIVIAKSKARLYLRQRQQQGEQVDADSVFLCGESNQFVQFLIFGFLFLTSGVLISVLGMWVPGCGTVFSHLPGNTTGPVIPAPKSCSFLTLQIMGPLIVLVGLCFFVVAHLKKKHVPSPDDEAAFDDEQQAPTPEPLQITVGNAVMVFPPPPPPYFTDQSSLVGRYQSTGNPPSYNSIFKGGILVNSPDIRADGNPEHAYTISTSSPSEIILSAYFSSDPPPKYEEKAEETNLPTPPCMPASNPDPTPTATPTATPKTVA